MKTLSKIPLIVIISFLFSCDFKEEENMRFTFPVINNSQLSDTTKKVLPRLQHINSVFPSFVGKYKFQDQIDINPEIDDTSYYNDFIWDYSRVRIDDSLDVNGFDLIVDYNTTIYYNKYYGIYSSTVFAHYPVYFVNSSKTDKIFLGKDSYVFGVQEARLKYKYSEFNPIEVRGFDFCGNGTWGLKVEPNEFVLVLMSKYDGDYETALRARFKMGECIYVSKPFLGKIDTNQFHLPDSSYIIDELQKTHGKAAEWLFYGAKIKDEEWQIDQN